VSVRVWLGGRDRATRPVAARGGRRAGAAELIGRARRAGRRRASSRASAPTRASAAGTLVEHWCVPDRLAVLFQLGPVQPPPPRAA